MANVALSRGQYVVGRFADREGTVMATTTGRRRASKNAAYVTLLTGDALVSPCQWKAGSEVVKFCARRRGLSISGSPCYE